MGEKHNPWRAPWIPTFLVVVSLISSYRSTVSKACLWCFSCFMTSRTPSYPPLVYSVFWDLYCAAPERRETCDHSSEAKAFHDYVSSNHMELFLKS